MYRVTLRDSAKKHRRASTKHSGSHRYFSAEELPTIKANLLAAITIIENNDLAKAEANRAVDVRPALGATCSLAGERFPPSGRPI